MSARLPRNVIVAKGERAPSAAHFVTLPIGPGYRSVTTLRLRSSVSLRVFTVREVEGS
jgi:hypothetical protein